MINQPDKSVKKIYSEFRSILFTQYKDHLDEIKSEVELFVKTCNLFNKEKQPSIEYIAINSSLSKKSLINLANLENHAVYNLGLKSQEVRNNVAYESNGEEEK